MTICATKAALIGRRVILSPAAVSTRQPSVKRPIAKLTPARILDIVGYSKVALRKAVELLMLLAPYQNSCRSAPKRRLYNHTFDSLYPLSPMFFVRGLAIM